MTPSSCNPLIVNTLTLGYDSSMSSLIAMNLRPIGKLRAREKSIIRLAARHVAKRSYEQVVGCEYVFYSSDLAPFEQGVYLGLSAAQDITLRPWLPELFRRYVRRFGMTQAMACYTEERARCNEQMRQWNERGSDGFFRPQGDDRDVIDI